MLDVTEIQKQIYERASKRAQAAKSFPESRAARIGSERITFSEDMLSDLAYLLDRYDTSSLPMINFHGVFVTIGKKILNRLMRFYTFWQARVNGAMVRILKQLPQRFESIETRLAKLERENSELREEIERLKGRGDG
ncbi:MAG: hypothetical protein NUW37_04980 [Planctomycetes bacterium]|nr:hypothetical protein [Planctomycetota bacterium]